MDLSKEIKSFIQGLINARGKLLAANIGKTTFSCLTKHERIAKDFDYCKALYKTDLAWAKFIQRHERDIREILIANRGLAKMENRLLLIIIEIQKFKP